MKPVDREKYEHRDYTSGKIISKHDQVYGRVEVKAKHPNGRGIWPAIWMMPRDESDATGYGWWPASGEIDIFEGRGQTPTKIQSGKLSLTSDWLTNDIYFKLAITDQMPVINLDFNINIKVLAQSI